MATAVLVFLTALALYTVWLPRDYSADDLQYAIVVEQATTGTTFYHPSGSVPFDPERAQTDAASSANRLSANPRYVLEWPTSYLAVTASRALGWRGTAIDPILATRIVAGALGLALFYLALRASGGGSGTTLAATAGLGTSAVYWTYSTHVDQSISMVVALCLALVLLALRRDARQFGRGDVPIALALALATLYNLTAGIAAIGVVLAFAIRRSLDAALRLAAVYGIAVSVGITVALAALLPFESLLSVEFWRRAAFLGHPEHGISIARDAARAALGLAKSQVVFPGSPGSLQQLWDSSDSVRRALIVAFFGGVLALMSVPFLSVALARRKPALSLVTVTLIAWLCLYASFGLFWDPGYVKYWLVPLLCWWGLVPIIHAEAAALARGWRLAVVAAAVVTATASVAINLTTQFIPANGEAANRWLAHSRLLSASEPGSLFVSPGHPLDFYLIYFARRDVVSTGLVRYGSGGDETAVSRVVGSRVASHRRVGGPVYVYSGARGQLHGAEVASLLRLVGATSSRVAWTSEEVVVYEALP